MTPVTVPAHTEHSDTDALPPGFRLTMDPSVRVYDDGRILAGGTPARVMRLTNAGRAAVAALQAGASASPAGRALGAAADILRSTAARTRGRRAEALRSPGARALGRRLIDAGLAHPVPPPVATMDVTVVVPVHDRVAELDRCLAAVREPDWPEVVPVVVVDDGSARAADVAAVCERHGAMLVRRDERGGPGAARNAALPLAETEFVAFLDSDCVPQSGWLATLAGHLADPVVGAVAPRIEARSPAAPDTALARFSEGRSPLDMGAQPSAVGSGGRVPYVPTAALLLRTAALPAGGFDPKLLHGEDVDLVWRLRDAGWRVRYEPAARVEHAEPDTWRALLSRRARYGTSAAPLAQRHPGRLAPAVLRPWPTAAAALLLAQRPTAALAATVLPAATFTRRMHRHGVPPSQAIAWSAGAVGHTLVGISRAATALAGPALLAGLASRRTRLAAATLLAAAPLADWARRRPPLDPVRWTAACIADDAAYGLGVWQGVIRERTLAPLLPTVGAGPAPTPRTPSRG